MVAVGWAYLQGMCYQKTSWAEALEDQVVGLAACRTSPKCPFSGKGNAENMKAVMWGCFKAAEALGRAV